MSVNDEGFIPEVHVVK